MQGQTKGRGIQLPVLGLSTKAAASHVHSSTPQQITEARIPQWLFSALRINHAKIKSHIANPGKQQIQQKCRHLICISSLTVDPLPDRLLRGLVNLIRPLSRNLVHGTQMNGVTSTLQNTRRSTNATKKTARMSPRTTTRQRILACRASPHLALGQHQKRSQIVEGQMSSQCKLENALTQQDRKQRH